MALTMLGADIISSIDESSNNARTLKVLYTPARDALLREIPWNFARRQVPLNALEEAPITLELLPNNHGPGVIVYTLALQAPDDFLRLLRWAPEDSHWRVIGSDTGMVFLTDAIPLRNIGSFIGTQPPNADGNDDLPAGGTFLPAISQLGIEYVARIIDPNQFDTLFRECLAAKIAEEGAYAITGHESMSDRMQQRFQMKFQEAAAVNGIEQWPDQMYDNTVVNVRYGYTSINLGT